MKFKELKEKLFKNYALFIKPVNILEEYDINKEYLFEYNNPSASYQKYEFKQTIANLLYRNYYWIAQEEELQEIYSEILDFGNSYVENNDFIIKVNIDNLDIDFKPKYIDKKNKKCFHYFDMSYFKGEQDRPRQLLMNIFIATENQGYTLEYNDYYDISQ